MTKNKILDNHLKFQTDIAKIIDYGIEIINDDDLPSKSEKKTFDEKCMLIEALLLRSCALWESFIEKELVYLVNLGPEKLISELGLPENTKLNLKLIKAILFSNSYRDFHDIERSKTHFKKIINDKYNIFQLISHEQSKKINFTYTMRNYLSHYSDFSKRKLLEGYKRDYKYKRFLEPGQFLLKKKGENFRVLIHNFKLVSIVMAKGLK